MNKVFGRQNTLDAHPNKINELNVLSCNRGRIPCGLGGDKPDEVRQADRGRAIHRGLTSTCSPRGGEKGAGFAKVAKVAKVAFRRDMLG